MADLKISALPASTTPLAGTEVLPVVQSGSTKQVSVANLTAGRIVSASKIISGNTNAATSFTAGTSANAGPNIEMYGTTSAAPGWTVYTSGVTNFASFGIESHWKNDFAGTATYLGGWFTNGDYNVNTGNVVIGTSGKGIDFSATPGTGTSELLADYEEGTWTPALLFDNTQVGSFTYTTQTGTYTKVGRLVTARFNLAWSARPSGGSVMVMNLPFNAVNAANVQGFISAQGGITNTGTYTITGGDGLTVSSYIASQCSICTVKSGGAFTDPLQQTALTSAAGSLAGEIIYEVS